MKIHRMSLIELQSWPDNPRKITSQNLDSLKKSVATMGWFKPFVVWEKDGMPYVISGNQRLAAARALHREGNVEFSTVPVVVYEGTYEDAKMIVLRDNNEDGEWDWESTSTLLFEMAGNDVDMSLTGFDSNTVADLLMLAEDADHIQIFDDETDVEPPEINDNPNPKKTEEKSVSDRVEDRKVLVMVGGVKGSIPLRLYDRFCALFDAYTANAEAPDYANAFKQMLNQLVGSTNPRGGDS